MQGVGFRLAAPVCGTLAVVAEFARVCGTGLKWGHSINKFKVYAILLINPRKQQRYTILHSGLHWSWPWLAGYGYR